jgi:ribonuclease HI
MKDEASERLPHVIIYTDGACDPNPGPGGWAALLRFGNVEKVITGSHPATTNNRMELTAAIEALRALKKPCRVDFYTDSAYLQRGIREWLPRWRARNWQRKGGSLANLDLWQALDAAIAEHQIAWHWVRAHASDPINQRVDRLARQAISG